jgi:hypothetical protein
VCAFGKRAQFFSINSRSSTGGSQIPDLSIPLVDLAQIDIDPHLGYLVVRDADSQLGFHRIVVPFAHTFCVVLMI